jgi:hypothetical protein
MGFVVAFQLVAGIWFIFGAINAFKGSYNLASHFGIVAVVMQIATFAVSMFCQDNFGIMFMELSLAALYFTIGNCRWQQRAENPKQDRFQVNIDKTKALAKDLKLPFPDVLTYEAEQAKLMEIVKRSYEESI